jgi:hypothetical protein
MMQNIKKYESIENNASLEKRMKTGPGRDRTGVP